MREQMQSMITADPMSFMRDMTEKNISMWKDMQDSFLGAAGIGGDSDEEPGERKKS